MQFSKDTEEVLGFLDFSTGDNLRKRNDLGNLLEIGASFDVFEIFNDLLFTGTYLWNVSQKLKRAQPREEGIETLNQELAKSTEELSELLKALSFYDEDLSKRFSEVYYVHSSGSVLNLIDLAHDIAELKQLQNRMKEKKAGKSD